MAKALATIRKNEEGKKSSVLEYRPPIVKRALYERKNEEGKKSSVLEYRPPIVKRALYENSTLIKKGQRIYIPKDTIIHNSGDYSYPAFTSTSESHLTVTKGSMSVKNISSEEMLIKDTMMCDITDGTLATVNKKGSFRADTDIYARVTADGIITVDNGQAVYDIDPMYDELTNALRTFNHTFNIPNYPDGNYVNPGRDTWASYTSITEVYDDLYHLLGIKNHGPSLFFLLLMNMKPDELRNVDYLLRIILEDEKGMEFISSYIVAINRTNAHYVNKKNVLDDLTLDFIEENSQIYNNSPL